MTSGFTIGEPASAFARQAAPASRRCSGAGSNAHCLRAGHVLFPVWGERSRRPPPPFPAAVRPNIPPWWIWAYWLSPFSWAVRSVVVNEFMDPKWTGIPVSAATPDVSVGQSVLDTFGFYTERFWVWAGVGYL